jgi:hypothetical protein
VVTAKCTSLRLFLDTTTCTTNYFSQSGNTVTLGASIVNDSGYVLYVHRQPSFQSADVDVADTIKVCYRTDDVPETTLPATGSTGWAVTVGGVSKTVASADRIGTDCYNLVLTPGGTLTTGGQAVTVANTTGGNITSGTAMINTTDKVPAAGFTAQAAQNNLSGGGGPGTPLLGQTKYQWQSNVGLVDTAPLYGVLNGQLTPSPGAQARLIVKYRNTTAAHTPTQLPLCFAIDPVDETDPTGGVPLTDSCATNEVCYTHALGISSTVPSTELLASDETVNIPCGLVQNTNSVPLITLSAPSETECIYVIKFKETLQPGQKVYFYPRRSGSQQLSSYITSNLPHATVVGARNDRYGGVMSGGTWR